MNQKTFYRVLYTTLSDYLKPNNPFTSQSDAGGFHPFGATLTDLRV